MNISQTDSLVWVGEPFCTSQEELNRVIVRRLFEQLVNQHNLAVIEELMAPDVVVHTAKSGVGSGHKGLRRLAERFVRRFPERYLELNDLIAAGDRVAARYTLYVVHGGTRTPLGVVGSFREATLGGITIFRLVDQRIVELWHQDDLPHVLGQPNELRSRSL